MATLKKEFLGYIVVDKTTTNQDRYVDYWAKKGGMPCDAQEGYIVFLDKNEAKDFSAEIKQLNNATTEIRKVYLEVGDVL